MRNYKLLLQPLTGKDAGVNIAFSEVTAASREEAVARFAAGHAELLTESERTAVHLAGQLYTLIAEKVVGNGPTREADLAELTAAVHVIQRSVMAQAAGRLFPDEFRLLGEVIDRGGKEPS